MLSDKKQREYYDAFINRDSEYEGVFFVGIKTTGIFCRPTCSARKPKFENCDFFISAQDALSAGYRACKKCHPLALPNEAPPLIQHLIDAVEEQPDKKWTDAEFRALGIDSSTVRRQFKKRFGMTFTAYARARRMGTALKEIQQGASVINAQLTAGYESDSGFRDAFARIIGKNPGNPDKLVLKAEWIDTPLGAMIAMADDHGLYLLEFTDRKGLEPEIKRLQKRLKPAIVPGNTPVTDMIKQELSEYFAGTRQQFETPIICNGSDFQESAWAALRSIPYGETCSYAQQAQKINNPKAVRAVAHANSSNQMAIIIPCHRVIGADGTLTGYAGGLARKEWLLNHEKQNKN